MQGMAPVVWYKTLNQRIHLILFAYTSLPLAILAGWSYGRRLISRGPGCALAVVAGKRPASLRSNNNGQLKAHKGNSIISPMNLPMIS